MNVSVRFAALFALAVALSEAKAQDVASAQGGAVAVMQAACAQFVPDPQAPGLSLAIQRGQADPVYLQCGRADVELGRSITVDTPFHVASITKQFVAESILKFAAVGAIDLDTPIDFWLGAFARDDVPTVRDLIHHRSGFYEHWVQWQLSDAPGGTLDDIVSLARAQTRPNFAPGETEAYTNLNYVLLAAILEEVSGKHLPALLREQIFTPSNMGETGFLLSDADRLADRAHGYSGDPQAPEAVTYAVSDILGDGGLYASAPDLIRWLATLQSVADDDPRIAAYPGAVTAQTYYAAGLHVTATETGRLLHHGGANRGASAWVGHDTSSEVSVVVLANSDSINAQQIGLDMLGRLSGQSVQLRYTLPSARAHETLSRHYIGAFNGQPVALELNVDSARMTLGAIGGEPRVYALGEDGVLFREDLPILQVRANASGALEFFVEGQPFETFFPVAMPSSPLPARFVGVWRSVSLPGRLWLIRLTDAGLSLDTGTGEAVALRVVVPGVYLDPSSGCFLALDPRGNLTVTRSGIRALEFER